MKRWNIYIYIYIFIYIFFKVNNWGKENLFKNIFVNILLCQFVKDLVFTMPASYQVYLMILYLYSQLTLEYHITYHV